MEAQKNESFSITFNQSNSPISGFQTFLRKTVKKHTCKSNTYLNGFTKNRIRRINSISQNISSLFKQNQHKLSLFLKSDSCLSNTICADNLQNPQIYTTISDGVYVLIQGSVRIISFSQQRPLPKSSMKEIINTHFRKLRTSKQQTPKMKDSAVQLVKKNSTHDKNQHLYGCGTFDQPFTVFECINQNCCSMSNETIIYMLDDDQKKNFKYYQNKQKLKEMIQQNRQFFRTNYLLFHTFLHKKLNFRTQFKVDNVALIKKGTLRVFSDQINKIQNSDVKLQNIKQQVCELCQPCLLVKGFIYEVSSFQAEIIFLQNNDTFQFFKNPDWVLRFQSISKSFDRQRESIRQSRKKLKNISFTKQMSKIGRHQLALQKFTTEHQGHESLPPAFFSTFHCEKKSGANVLGHKKSFSEVRCHTNEAQNRTHRLLLHEKERKQDMLKMISPYVLISQKTGLKEIIKTRNILNQRNQNVSPMRVNQLLKLTKVSRSHLNKYQSQHFEPMLMQKYNIQNIPRERRGLLKFQKFLQQKNHRKYRQKVKENNERIQKSHRKSSSELGQTGGGSNYYLGLRKKRMMEMHVTFEMCKEHNWTKS